MPLDHLALGMGAIAIERRLAGKQVKMQEQINE